MAIYYNGKRINNLFFKNNKMIEAYFGNTLIYEATYLISYSSGSTFKNMIVPSSGLESALKTIDNTFSAYDLKIYDYPFMDLDEEDYFTFYIEGVEKKSKNYYTWLNWVEDPACNTEGYYVNGLGGIEKEKEDGSTSYIANENLNAIIYMDTYVEKGHNYQLFNEK